MGKTGVELTAIAPTSNMRYPLGFSPVVDERLCRFLVTPEATELVVPALDADQMEARTRTEMRRSSDEAGGREALQRALDDLDALWSPVLAADAAKRADALLILQEVAQPAAQADQVIMIGIEACQPGVTEREGAQQKAQTFGDDGAEEDHATLVAFGANRAFPHHEAGNRKPSRGDTVVIDIVATLDGYKSDITRVVHPGDPSADGREVYATVLEANQRGREPAQAGARASALDLGLEHPGPGAGHGLRFGVRIEDIVVVADGPCCCLTGLDRALTVRDL